MTPAESLQLDMQHLREKNEEFFKNYEPSVYQLIKGKKLGSIDLQIIKSGDSLELDVIEQGQSLYFNRGQYYCQQEADKFLKQMHPGNLFPPFVTTDSSIFSFKRVGSMHFKELAEHVGQQVNAFDRVPLPDFYPLLVITGTGLSFHIENILNNRNVGSLIIYEHSIERFLVSLYSVDWQRIYQKFNPDKGTSIQLIISANNDPNVLKGILWNELVHYCPQFPFTTLFYNHLMDKKNEGIIESIRKDIINYLQQWGHYDDEINQYNNARQNFLHGARAFQPTLFNINPDIPVAVVAAGPSLDSRIEILKKNRDKMLIISCGTTIGTLAKYDIKPHFHVELESDYIVYEAIDKATSAEFRKGIKLLAAAQVNPRCLALFEESFVFFKDSTALSELYVSDKNDIVPHTTPTCTNAGVAIANKLGFKNIFLFGTDFGFANKNQHHASGSIYYQDKEEISAVLHEANDFDKEPTIEVTGVNGQPLETKPLYFVSKRMVEECIKYSHKKNTTVYNCSDGASIKNSHWLPTDALQQKLDSISQPIPPEQLAQLIYDTSKVISSETIEQKSKLLLNFVDTVFATIIKRKVKDRTIQGVSQNIFIINNIISRHVYNNMGYLYYFIRGQVWLYLAMYFTFALSSKSQEDLDLVIDNCEEWLIEHKKRLISEMKYILFHEMSLDEDPWVNETVEDR